MYISMKVKNMGWAQRAQSIQVQNPNKLSFSNVELVWVKDEHYRGSNKKSIDVAYNPYAHVQEFLKGEQGNLRTSVEWNIHKFIHKKTCQKHHYLTLLHAYLVCIT
jgi:hypothetical protein